jgi:hypothetical protein
MLSTAAEEGLVTRGALPAAGNDDKLVRRIFEKFKLFFCFFIYLSMFIAGRSGALVPPRTRVPQ